MTYTILFGFTPPAPFLVKYIGKKALNNGYPIPMAAQQNHTSAVVKPSLLSAKSGRICLGVNLSVFNFTICIADNFEVSPIAERETAGEG